MGQYHFDPAGYLELMRSEVPLYDRLQEEVAVAAADAPAARILELGTGTGETAARLLAAHPDARLVGVDVSAGMLAEAARRLPSERVELREARLEDPLPAGPFDLVASCLAVHHLDGDGKRDLFARVAGVLTARGRLVLGDVVVPERPEDAVTPLSPGYDRPSTVADQLAWLEQAGLPARVAWAAGDLAVLAAARPR